MAVEIIKGVALLLALCMLQSINLRLLRDHARAAAIAGGLLFGAISVIGMLFPLVVVPGVLVDARSVVLVCAGLFGGPAVALIAALIAAAYRLHLGGLGAVVGVAVIFSCVAMGLVYRHLHQTGKVGIGALQLLAFGALVHLFLGLGIYLQLPAAEAPGLVQHLGSLIILTYVPATMVLGLVLKDAENLISTQRDLQQTSARLRAIGDAIPDPLFVLDEDGRYVEVLSTSSNLLCTG